MIDIPTYNEIWEFIKEQTLTNQFFSSVGLLAVLRGLWEITKSWPAAIWQRVRRKIIYTVNIEETDEFFLYFENWLNKNHKKSYRNVQVTSEKAGYRRTHSLGYNDNVDTMDSTEEDKLVFRQYQDLFFVRRGIFLLRIYKGREKLENANNLLNAFYNNFKISGFFAKRAINKLLQEVLEMKIAEDKARELLKVRVFTNSGDYWMAESDFKPKGLDTVILEDKDLIVNDIHEFLRTEQWYIDRNIAYKRSYMFKGPPGTGKTTLALALSKEFKRNIYVLNPSGVKDSELRELFRNLGNNCILLIEDIDAVFSKKRDKKDVDVKFNFSTLLNCLDGVFSKEGLITIFTTNHPEDLDAALVREGRVDIQIYVGLPKIEQIEEYMSKFFNTKIKLDVPENVTNDKISMAKVQELCLQNKSTSIQAAKSIEKILNHNETKV